MSEGKSSEIIRVSGSGASRLDYIDGLRAVAMLMVLFFHTAAFGGRWQLSFEDIQFNLGSVLKPGSTGVSLFLVLSGFCLYWPFATGKPEPTLWQFAKKRAHRILPPYYIALVLFFLYEMARVHWFGVTPTDDAPNPWISLLLHATMLHNVRSETYFDINGSFWSLALESQLYVLFPLMVEAFRRFNRHAILILMFAATCAFRFAALKAGNMDPTNEAVNVLVYSVFGRAFEFTLGMFAAWRVAELRRGEKLVRPTDIAAIAVPFVVSLAAAKLHYGEVTKAAITGCLYVSLLLSAAPAKSIVHRALSMRWIVFLGVISYSVYLVHHPLTGALGAVIARPGTSDLQHIGLGLFVTIPLLLAVGCIYYFLCEKPFLNSRNAARTSNRDTDEGSRVKATVPVAAAPFTATEPSQG